MSFNRLIGGNENIIVESCSIDKNFALDPTTVLLQENYGLILNPNDDNSYSIAWEEIDVGAVNLYTNQTEVFIRSASYSVNNEPMYFDGFKFSQPSYVNITNAGRTISISSVGWYMCTFTIASPTLNTSTGYKLTLNQVDIPGSIMTTIPSSLSYGSANQHITSTSTCIFRIWGASNLQLQIIPNVITAVESAYSNFTLIKLL